MSRNVTPEAKKLPLGQKVGVAIGFAALVVGLWVVVDRNIPRSPPPVVEVAPRREPVRHGPVIAVPENAGKEQDVKVASIATEDFKLPSKFNEEGVRMYANLNWVGDKKLQIQFLGRHLGVVPGKGYCKLMPTVVVNRARPFVNTTGKWISTEPPVYELWHREGVALPTEFRAVYVRNEIWYFVDLERAYADGEQILVSKPGETGKRYVQSEAQIPSKR